MNKYENFLYDLAERYYYREVTNEERVFIEAELALNDELQDYVKGLKESDDEARKLYPLESQPKLVHYLNSLKETAPQNAGMVVVFFVNPYIGSRERGEGEQADTAEEFDGKIAGYEEAYRKNPRDYNACINLALLHNNRGDAGDFEKVIDYGTQALALKDGDALALFLRGNAYNEQGESEKALTDLSMVAETGEERAKDAWFIIGMIHYKEGEPQKSQSAFEKVKAMDPDYPGIDKALRLAAELEA